MTAPDRQVWRWVRWTRWPVSVPTVLLAAAVVVLDIVTVWTDVSLGHVGRVDMSPALPLAAVLVILVGPRRIGLDRHNRAAWREFTAITTLALVVAIAAYATIVEPPEESLGMVVAAFGEELVYRFALVVVVGVIVARLFGRNWRNAEHWGAIPGLVALIVSAGVFTALPGHIAQVSDTLHVLPFVSLALVLGYAVLRTGALFPATVVHALLNLTTVAAESSDAPASLRFGIAAAALVALIAGTALAGRRLGIMQKVSMDASSSPAVAPS